MSNSLKSRFLGLPFNKKLVLISSFCLLISMFMPWYSDIDQFKTGDSFLGITGPMYLAGLFILVAAAVSFGMISMELLDRPSPDLPVENKYVHVAAGGFSVLMLVLMLSVYFHPKFGVNLTDKNAEFGMILGFIGMVGIIGGALMKEKKKSHSVDSLLNADDRVQQSVEKLDEAPYSAPVSHERRIPTIEELTEQINNTSDININER